MIYKLTGTKLFAICMIANTLGGDVPYAENGPEFYGTRQLMCKDVKTGYKNFKCCQDVSKCFTVDSYKRECCGSGSEANVTVSKKCGDTYWFKFMQIMEEQGYYNQAMNDNRRMYTLSYDEIQSLSPNYGFDIDSFDFTSKTLNLAQVEKTTVTSSRDIVAMNNIAKRLIPKMLQHGATKTMPSYLDDMTYIESELIMESPPELTPQWMEDNIFSDEESNDHDMMRQKIHEMFHGKGLKLKKPAANHDTFQLAFMDLGNNPEAYSFKKLYDGTWTIIRTSQSADHQTLSRNTVKVLDVINVKDMKLNTDCSLCDSFNLEAHTGSEVTVIEIEMEDMHFDSESGVYIMSGPGIKDLWDPYGVPEYEKYFIKGQATHPDAYRQFLIIEKHSDGSYNLMVYKGVSAAVYYNGDGGFNIKRDGSNLPQFVTGPILSLGNRETTMRLAMDGNAFLTKDFATITEEDLIRIDFIYSYGQMVPTMDLHQDGCFAKRQEFEEFGIYAANTNASITQYPEVRPVIMPPNPPPPPLPPSPPLLCADGPAGLIDEATLFTPNDPTLVSNFKLAIDGNTSVIGTSAWYYLSGVTVAKEISLSALQDAYVQGSTEELVMSSVSFGVRNNRPAVADIDFYVLVSESGLADDNRPFEIEPSSNETYAAERFPTTRPGFHQLANGHICAHEAVNGVQTLGAHALPLSSEIKYSNNMLHAGGKMYDMSTHKLIVATRHQGLDSKDTRATAVGIKGYHTNTWYYSIYTSDSDNYYASNGENGYDLDFTDTDYLVGWKPAVA